MDKVGRNANMGGTQELRSCPCFDTGARAFYTQMLTDLYGGKIMKKNYQINRLCFGCKCYAVVFCSVQQF